MRKKRDYWNQRNQVIRGKPNHIIRNVGSIGSIKSVNIPYIPYIPHVPTITIGRRGIYKELNLYL